MPKHTLSLLLLMGLATASSSWAQVHYDKGRRQVLGFQLLQDSADENTYYYVPRMPRLATKDDGSFELLCLKYVGTGELSSGGLFHALVEFALPPDLVAELDEELQKENPNARIAGPVPMKPVDAAEAGVGSFEIISASLSYVTDEGESAPAVITSGTAPVTPGSKAVVAAILKPDRATLLWDSFVEGSTSDVSVSINAYYEALVEGYNARVQAEVSTIYEHFSAIRNRQSGYTRRQLRDVTDELHRDGILDIQVVDRSEGLDLDASAMESLLNLVTDKLVELMFDAETGWSVEPPREAAVEHKQLLGRRKRGFFSRVFGGSRDPKYITDDQFVLKKREDIRRNVFVLNLSKSTTIQVPVRTAGNLAGLYEALEPLERYFRIVNLDDPAFETREIHFQLDGAFVEPFNELINFVSVNFRKRYANATDVTRSVLIDYEAVAAGQTRQSVAFPRLGVTGADWTDYEYQVRWALRDGRTLTEPARDDQWMHSRDAAVALSPPLVKREIEVDADRTRFAAKDVATAVVEFASDVGGEIRSIRKLVLRAADTETTTKLTLYHDADAPVVFGVSWHAPTGKVRKSVALLESDYLYLVPPERAGEQQ